MAVRVCEHCGREYEGAPQSRFCSDAHRKAYSRAKAEAGAEIRQEQVARGVQAPKRREPDPTVERPTTVEGLKRAALTGEIDLTEAEEQFIRNAAGFTSSEKRTFLQRYQTAQRIKERHPLPAPGSTITRYLPDGTPVEEPVGPAGLSLVAFPVQREGDLKPTEEQLRKLGETTG